jgi:hypothetical protein
MSAARVGGAQRRGVEPRVLQAPAQVFVTRPADDASAADRAELQSILIDRLPDRR